MDVFKFYEVRKNMSEERVSLADLLILTISQLQEKTRTLSCEELIRLGMLVKNEVAVLKKLSERTFITKIPKVIYEAPEETRERYRAAEIVFDIINNEVIVKCHPSDILRIALSIEDKEKEKMR